MNVKIRWRVDTSEVFETDDVTLHDVTWEDVLEAVRGIEASHTVIEITNLDID